MRQRTHGGRACCARLRVRADEDPSTCSRCPDHNQYLCLTGPPPTPQIQRWLLPPRAQSRCASRRATSPTRLPSACLPAASCSLAMVLLPRHACGPPERLLNRSWDEKQRERSRLARLAMLERDNHHTDNTHMMKVQNLADDEIVGGGVLGSAA